MVKVDRSNRFANCIEWDIWNNMYKQKPEVKHFFAPCHYISKEGKILIQSRTIPIPSNTIMEIPKFLWDLRSCNFGFLNGIIVCHDYSGHELYENVDLSLVKKILE